MSNIEVIDEPCGKGYNLKKVRGYEYLVDDSGDVKAVQRSTGEVIEAMWMLVPLGSKVYTPESLNSRNEYLQHQKNNYLRKALNKELGKFFFIYHNEDFRDLSPQTVTRLVYLNTFIDFDNNKLMLTKHTPMKRKDLANVLGVSKAVVSKFWSEVCPKYIREQDDGLIFTNTEIFIKRKLNHNGGYVPYEKFYINGIRALYKATDISNHKHLGYVFKMLPYINLEYNTLCKNPLEQNLDNIEFMSLAEFCNIIDYDVSQLSRLLKIYKSLTFEVKTKQERFCAFVYDGLDRGSARIFVNPHIFYNGSNYDQVKVLGKFCAE